jgi:hypothetical protein
MTYFTLLAYLSFTVLSSSRRFFSALRKQSTADWFSGLGSASGISKWTRTLEQSQDQTAMRQCSTAQRALAGDHADSPYICIRRWIFGSAGCGALYPQNSTSGLRRES